MLHLQRRRTYLFSSNSDPKRTGGQSQKRLTDERIGQARPFIDTISQYRSVLRANSAWSHSFFPGHYKTPELGKKEPRETGAAPLHNSFPDLTDMPVEFFSYLVSRSVGSR